MYESPRIRRLRSDLAAMERLQAESSVLRFRASKHDHRTPPQHYVITFHGKSLARERGPVVVRDRHEVEIKLGASYPRTMPEIRWLSPIYHPNISEIGMVCLGGYGTHWVPSLNLDELCGMLWDMARFHNYDIRSPYNRESALWVANQTAYLFPLDARPLRDLRAALGRIESGSNPASTAPDAAVPTSTKTSPARSDSPGSKAARYLEFMRRRQGGPQASTSSVPPSNSAPSSTPALTPAPQPNSNQEPLPPPFWEEDNPPHTEEVVILDMEVDLRPIDGQPRASSDEIVFID
jgi:ubiquitin-protein ligase